MAVNESPEEKLAALGLSLPPLPAPGGNYVSAKRLGSVVYLAGAIFMVMAFSPRQAVPLFLGAMFFFVGSIWVVIGAKYKKDADQRS